MGGKGRCERRSEALVKIQKKKMWGGGGGRVVGGQVRGDRVGGVRVDVNRVKFL